MDQPLLNLHVILARILQITKLSVPLELKPVQKKLIIVELIGPMPQTLLQAMFSWEIV